MNSRPLVSVIIPTYNRREMVAEAIESVLAQSYPNVEVVVVDDGSTDGTGEYLNEKFGDKIRYIHQDNAEKSAARNNGIRQARGEFVSMLDSDDVLLEGAIEAMVTCFDSRPEADAVYGLKVRERGDGSLPSLKVEKQYPDGAILTHYAKERFIHNNSYMVRRVLMLNEGMYSEELTNHEDVELLLRLTSRFKFYFCGTYVCNLRKSDGSARTNYDKIIAQGISAMERLYSAGDVTPELLAMKGRLYAEESLMVAMGAYRSGRYSLFRYYFFKALYCSPAVAFRFRFLRRLVVSLFKTSS